MDSEVAMKTKVTFRHLKPRPELQAAAEEAAERFEKFFDGITTTDVIFNSETDNMVEFTVHVQGNTFVVKENSEDFTKSLNIASDKMIRQIKKWKEKVREN
jgi:ribosomal subunit interface protein